MHDLPSIRASGEYGELRVSYQCAAALADWRLDLVAAVPRTFTFEATITNTHDYWFGQPPFDLAVSMGLTEWIWRNVPPPTRVDGKIRITLTSRPEVTARQGKRE